MTDEEKLNQLVELAHKTGRLWVADDVYELLFKYKDSLPPATSFVSIDVHRCKWMKPGDVMAVNDKGVLSHWGFKELTCQP